MQAWVAKQKPAGKGAHGLSQHPEEDPLQPDRGDAVLRAGDGRLRRDGHPPQARRAAPAEGCRDREKGGRRLRQPDHHRALLRGDDDVPRPAERGSGHRLRVRRGRGGARAGPHVRRGRSRRAQAGAPGRPPADVLDPGVVDRPGAGARHRRAAAARADRRAAPRAVRDLDPQGRQPHRAAHRRVRARVAARRRRGRGRLLPGHHPAAAEAGRGRGSVRPRRGRTGRSPSSPTTRSASWRASSTRWSRAASGSTRSGSG